MTRLLSLMLACLGGLAIAQAEDPPKIVTLHESLIVFPNFEQYVPQMPVEPAKGARQKIYVDTQFIIKNNEQCVVTSSPLGFVDIKGESIPQGETIRESGFFVDSKKDKAGNLLRETRVFKGPCWIYKVEPVVNGECEILAWKIGEKDASKITRRLVEANVAPIPPPGPTPTPIPPKPIDPPIPPKPVNPLPSDTLHVLIRYDSAKTLTPAQTGVIGSSLATNYVESVGGRWRRWPLDQTTEKELDKWFKDAQARPKTADECFIISSPKGFEEGPMPTTHQAWMDLLAKYGGK